MDSEIRAGQVGGLLLAIGGIGFLLAGVLHPRPHAVGLEFHDAMTSMLSHPLWPAAHWIALVTGLVLAWAVWMLVDARWVDNSVAAHAGAGLTIVSTVFMSVQWAVEIAARGALETYAAGEAVPIAHLIDVMQAVGWPGLGLGFGLLATGMREVAPRWLRILAAVGGAAIALAGLLAQGLHILQAGVLFLGGNFLALWMVWAGIRIIRDHSERGRQGLVG
jgi:hypothetical protein